jgi:transcriptional regulator with XRE-family HTH domain
MSKKNIGSSFDDFLQEESLLESSTAVALKRVIAWQIDQEMKAQKLTKTELAKRMHTSRAALNRLLDENDASLTLTTLASAAAALGKKVNLQLAAALPKIRVPKVNFYKYNSSTRAGVEQTEFQSQVSDQGVEQF